MGAKLTVVTRDLEVIFTSDDFEEAVAYYKSQSTGGLFAVHVLDNPDRSKRIRSGVLVVEEKPKRKKDVVVV
jgi:hypothetical protein